MPKLRRLSGAEVVAIFARFGFSVASQRGSHIKLKRTTVQGTQTLTVPAHRELDTGTLRAIVRQAARFIPERDLRLHFYESTDQVHEPDQSERTTNPELTSIALASLVPAEWAQAEEAAVWVTCFCCMGLGKADLKPGRLVDLGEARALVLYGQVPYVAAGDLQVRSAEQPEFRTDIKITRSAEGAYLLIFARFDHGDSGSELHARTTAEWAAGLLAVVLGRNLVYRRLFEHVAWLKKPKWQIHTPVFRNPAKLPRPVLSSERLALCTQASRQALRLTDAIQNRVLLSLRWFAQAFDSGGIDEFLKDWVALEALGMRDKNIKPILETLQRAYRMSSTGEVDRRFAISSLSQFRSRILHHGLMPSISGDLLDYLEGLYKDVLFDVLGLPSEGAACAVMARPGFHLSRLLCTKKRRRTGTRVNPPP